MRRGWTCVVVVACTCAAGTSARAQTLYSNGPIVTNPTGGTGTIAGLPISNADGFNVPGSTFLFSTTGVGATIPAGVSLADDFVVPAGGWDLDAVTLYAFQTSQTTATVTTVRINLWDATPYSANSPAPIPDPLPMPRLSTPLELPAGPGEFVCHRQSPTSTSTVRPVYAYTVSLNALPNGGRLAPGRYWLEWSFQGALTPSQNVFVPLVSPRTAVTGHNARLYNSIDGSSTGPRSWFEGREGFVAGQADGRAYELPFVLMGTPLCVADTDDGTGSGTPDGGVTIDDLLYYLDLFEAGAPAADVDDGTSTGTPDGGVTIDDLLYYLLRFGAGC